MGLVDEFLLNFLPELIGAGVGAYLGYRWGIKQEKDTRRKEEQEVKNSLIQSLIKELACHKSIYESTGQFIKPLYDEGSLMFQLPPFYREALIVSSFDSIVYSGIFRYISPETQIQTSTYYKDVKKLNDYIAYLSKIIERDVTYTISQEDEKHSVIGEALGRELSEYFENIEHTKDKLNENVDDLITKLKMDLIK